MNTNNQISYCFHRLERRKIEKVIMSLMKKIKLYLTFYNTFNFASIVLSIICAYFFFLHGISAFSILFWFKIITLALTFFYIREYKANEFYFYKNLGISKKALWIFSICLDFIIYFVIIIIAINLHGKYT